MVTVFEDVQSGKYYKQLVRSGQKKDPANLLTNGSDSGNKGLEMITQVLFTHLHKSDL